MLYSKPLCPAGSSVPCVSMEHGKGSHQQRRKTSFGRTSPHTMVPSSNADRAIPPSTRAAARSLHKAPSAMTMGKTTGSSHSAGAPSCAPQMPTASMAST